MIKADDLAFVRFRAPDLDRMEAFLVDFGMERAHRDDDTLYMRGAGTSPWLHVTHRGEAGFAGVGFLARNLDDLKALAATENVPVEALDGPGGGSRIRLTDPDGFNVEVVAARQPAPVRPLPAQQPHNDSYGQPRRNELLRTGAGASQVRRIGHCVLNVSNFRASEAWYKARLGLLTSDEIRMSPEFSLGAFMRCDRGSQPADHHTIFLLGTGEPRFNHAAFEVAGMDDLMKGHDHLKSRTYTHQWGIGRHFLGSQIFDYWRDPWGHMLEHWTDGDLLTADWGSRDSTIQDVMGVQWGMPMPPGV